MFILGCVAFIVVPLVIWHIYMFATKGNTILTTSVSMLWAGLVLFFFITCLTRIYPGEVGVVVDMMGMHQGVEAKVLTVGIHPILPWQSVYHFPVFQQNHTWEGKEGFNFQTSEGLSVHADIGISYELEADKVPVLFQKYRRGIDEITTVFLPNNIRDAINKVSSKMKIEELYGEKKEDFFKMVLDHVRSDLNPLGFKINSIFIMGQFKVPDIVMEALNRKIEATQKAQQRENELRETEAQAKKEMAKAQGEASAKVLTARGNADSLLIEAKSTAEANALLTKSLSSELIRWESVNKWDGKMPQFVGGSNGVMFQLPFEEGDKK